MALDLCCDDLLSKHLKSPPNYTLGCSRVDDIAPGTFVSHNTASETGSCGWRVRTGPGSPDKHALCK